MLFPPLAGHGWAADRADYPGSPNPKSMVASGKPADANTGVYFAPEFVPNWTTGTTTTSSTGTTISSTFYCTSSTLNPYGEVIVKSTITSFQPSGKHKGLRDLADRRTG